MTGISISTLAFWLLILSVLFTGIAVVLAYSSRWLAVVTAFVALILGKYSGVADIDASSLIFWGVAVLIVLAINYLLPSQIRSSRTGVAFFATGALAGAFLGLLFNTVAGVICASAVGVIIGAVAFSRLPAGRVLEFPTNKFFNYLCAKGLPLVVIFSMLGILCLHFINLGARL